MKRYTFFIMKDVLREVRKEVKLRKYESVSAFLRKLIRDYFENQKKPNL